MKNRLVPKRRFKEFNEVWKTAKIKDCIFYIKGFAFKSKYYRKEGIRIIRVSDLGTTEIIDNNEKIFIDRFYQKKYEAYELNLGDIIITTVGSKAELKESAVGRPILVKSNNQGLLNQNLVKLSPINDYDSYFIYGNLLKRRYVDYIRSIERGNANQANITINDLLEYNINHGCTFEQKKIGEFFKVLDDRIANQERKIAKVKALKSAYLTEMLPQKGENVPKRRFKGYTEKWNYCLLKEVINSEFKGKAKAEMQGGNSPYLDTNYLNGGEISYVNLPNDVEKDDVLILWDGSQAGMVYHGFEGALGSTLKAYKPKYSGEFLYQFLKKNQKVIFEQYRTPNIPHVINTFVDEFWICMPSIEEQQKIGQFFKNLDDQITTEEKKLEKLKKMKEAYLEEMFV